MNSTDTTTQGDTAMTIIQSNAIVCAACGLAGHAQNVCPDRTPPTTPTCEWEMEAWGPHDGCREFMTEPEAIFTCDSPATVLFKAVFHGPCGDEDEQWFACAAHAEQVENDSPYLTIVGRETV